jgi:hypothetical protein
MAPCLFAAIPARQKRQFSRLLPAAWQGGNFMVTKPSTPPRFLRLGGNQRRREFLKSELPGNAK